MIANNSGQRLRIRNPFELVLAAIILAIGTGLVLMIFDRLPMEGTSLGLDWQSIRAGFPDGRVVYGFGFRAPPWMIPFYYPLTTMPFRTGWGLLSFFTLAILLLSVPRVHKRWLYLSSIILLAVSHPSLRHLADGNLEGFMIAGILLIIYGFRTVNPLILAIGILIATSKIQESWLLIITLGIYLLRAWPVRKWLTLGIILAVVTIPSLLWMGREWLERGIAGIAERGLIVDMSLASVLTRLGSPTWLTSLAWLTVLLVVLYITWTGHPNISREKAALLIAASLALAPYSVGNSFLTVLAVGIIPLFQSHRWIGLLLIALADLLFFVPPDFSFQWGSTYWLVVLLVTAGVMSYYARRIDKTYKLAAQ
jgi:hypothetical protein